MAWIFQKQGALEIKNHEGRAAVLEHRTCGRPYLIAAMHDR